MQFVLERTGLISGRAASLNVSIITQDGGWQWSLHDDGGDLDGGRCAALDEALVAAAVAAGTGSGRWTLALPCGGRLALMAPTIRVPVEEALASHGYARAEGGRAYLGLSLQATATAEQARAALETLLDPAERAQLGAIDRVETAGALSHWCADLPLPVSGFVHEEQMRALVDEALSHGAAALVIGAEAEWVAAPALAATPR